MMGGSFPISVRAKLTEWEKAEIGYDATPLTFRVNVTSSPGKDVNKMIQRRMCKTMVDAGWGRMVAGEALHRISIVLSWLSLINNDDEPPKDGNDNCQQRWYDRFPAMVRIKCFHIWIISSLCPGKAMAVTVKKAKWLLIIHQSCVNWFESIKVVPIGLESWEGAIATFHSGSSSHKKLVSPLAKYHNKTFCQPWWLLHYIRHL